MQYPQKDTSATTRIVKTEVLEEIEPNIEAQVLEKDEAKRESRFPVKASVLTFFKEGVSSAGEKIGGVAQTTASAVQDASSAAARATGNAADSVFSALGHTTSITLNTVKGSSEAAQQATQQFIVANQAQLRKLNNSVQKQSLHSLELIGQVLEDCQANIVGLGASGTETVSALKELPRNVQALSQEMPQLAKRLKSAGRRPGDLPRTEADVLGLFDKIPGTSKLGAREANIKAFTDGKHASHIQPHSSGGSNGAENILWEVGTDNISRGAKVMTDNEQLYIRFHNAVESVLQNSTTISRLGVTAVGTAVLTQVVITAFAHMLDLHRGDISAEEFRDKILEAAVSAGIAAPIFFLLLIAVLALFPEAAVILAAPTVVSGFNALLGIGIALPLIQSVARHVEAEGYSFHVADKTQPKLQ